MSYPPDGPRRTMWRITRPVLTIGVLVAAAIGLVTAASWLGTEVGSRFASEPEGAATTVEPGQEVEVVIPAGASAASIAQLLEEEGVVRSATQFEAAVRTEGMAGSLRAGRYDMLTGMSSDEVMDILRRGPLILVFDVTVPEGLRVAEMIGVLSEASGIPEADFEDALGSTQVTTSLREMPADPALSDWEGLLFPDTYEFSEETTAAGMLQRMASTMEQRVGSVDWTALRDAGYSVYEGIVIASLVESEVRVPDERPIVSSVIRNRLAEGMPLQIDATVLYALGTRDSSDFDSQVESPYNTYANPGLPPTPIAAPGRASLEAAANPASTDYRFYVLANEEGAHTFSVTFEEHQEARQKACEAGLLSC